MSGATPSRHWLKSNCRAKIRMRAFCAPAKSRPKLAINVGFDEARGVTELTILVNDHPWLLSIIAGACASPAPTSSTRRSTPPPTDAQLDTTRESANIPRRDEDRRAYAG